MKMDDEARALVRRLVAALLPAARDRLGSNGDVALDKIADTLASSKDLEPDPVVLLFAAGAALRVTASA